MTVRSVAVNTQAATPSNKMNEAHGPDRLLGYKPAMSKGSERTPKDSHYARLRRAHRDRTVSARSVEPSNPPEGQVRLYGLHTVAAALGNPVRSKHLLRVSRNAAARLDLDSLDTLPFAAELVDTKSLDRLCGSDAVHQGAVLDADPLVPKRLSDMGSENLLVVLDQVTDPHNVGAIMRSAVAFGAGAIVTTARHSPVESGVLAKAASGALEHIDLVNVRNLADALEEIAGAGFQTIGLDSEGPSTLENTVTSDRIALVLGAEGKGLRQKTRSTVSALARLDMPGAIRSLNVSNAAAISLYIASAHLSGGES